jgi:Male sterility protein
VRAALKLLNTAAAKLAAAGTAIGGEAVGREAQRLMGVVTRDFFFQFREPTHLSDKQVRERVQTLQKDGRAMLRARGRNPRLHVLLTGATGFLGKEILVQAAADRRIEQVVAVVRPETVRDPKTKERTWAHSGSFDAARGDAPRAGRRVEGRRARARLAATYLAVRGGYGDSVRPRQRREVVQTRAEGGGPAGSLPRSLPPAHVREPAARRRREPSLRAGTARPRLDRADGGNVRALAQEARSRRGRSPGWSAAGGWW